VIVSKSFVALVGPLLVFAPIPAFAYLGPGAGLSAIGAVLVLMAAMLLAIVGFVWYPLKRLLGANRTKTSAKRPSDTDT